MKVKVRNPNIQVLLHKVVTRTSATGNVSATTGSGAPISFSSNSVATLPASSSYSELNQTDSASNVIDVTKWLGEGSVVRVQKSVRGDGGAFSIDFVDEIMGDMNDTLATLIESVDMFEIRFAGDAYKFAGSQLGQHQGASGPGQLPIQMRGFVSKVARSQSISADGKPRRTITVTGHDYHKILQNDSDFQHAMYSGCCKPDFELPDVFEVWPGLQRAEVE